MNDNKLKLCDDFIATATNLKKEIKKILDACHGIDDGEVSMDAAGGGFKIGPKERRCRKLHVVICIDRNEICIIDKFFIMSGTMSYFTIASDEGREHIRSVITEWRNRMQSPVCENDAP